jgi:hypothetical protein
MRLASFGIASALPSPAPLKPEPFCVEFTPPSTDAFEPAREGSTLSFSLAFKPAGAIDSPFVLETARLWAENAASAANPDGPKPVLDTAGLVSFPCAEFCAACEACPAAMLAAID